MNEPKDMVVPLLREMREEMRTRFDQMDARFKSVEERLSNIEGRQKSYQNALSADSMMSKIFIGDFEERIGNLEKQVAALVKAK